MNLHQLRYFKKLVEVRHFGRASRELFISQSTLSMAISSLEKELSAPLFDRSGRALSVTGQGEILYRAACISLRELDGAVERIEHFGQGKDPVVRIAAVSSVIRSDIPVLISRFRAASSEPMQFEIAQATTYEAMRRLREGECDVAICGCARQSQDVEAIPLVAHEVAAMVNVEHDLATKGQLTIDDLRNTRVVSYRPDSYMCQVFSGVLAHYGLPYIPGFDDEVGAASLVSGSRETVALTLATVSDLSFPRVKLMPVEELIGYHHLVVCVCRRSAVDGGPLSQFVDFLEHESANRHFGMSLLSDRF